MREFCLVRVFPDISPNDFVKVCFGSEQDRKTNFLDKLNQTWGNKNVKLETEGTSWIESFDTPLILPAVVRTILGVDWTHMRQITDIRHNSDGTYVLERKATTSGVMFAEYYDISFIWKISFDEPPSVSPSTRVELRGKCAFSKKNMFAGLMENTLLSECTTAQNRLLDFTQKYILEYTKENKVAVTPLPSSSPTDVGLNASNVLTKRYQAKAAYVDKRSNDGLTWDKRWLVIQGVHLTYKNEVTDTEYVGAINLTKCSVSPVEEAEVDDKNYYFITVKSDGSAEGGVTIFCLRYETQVDAEDWARTIQQNVAIWRHLAEQKAKKTQKRSSKPSTALIPMSQIDEKGEKEATMVSVKGSEPNQTQSVPPPSQPRAKPGLFRRFFSASRILAPVLIIGMAFFLRNHPLGKQVMRMMRHRVT